jgi:hypothetical protein
LVKKLNLYPIVKYIIMITTDMCWNNFILNKFTFL